MKALTEQDIKVLLVLKEYPQGATLTQVQRFADEKKKEYAFARLKKLIKKGHAERRQKLYHLKGDLPAVGSSVHITETQRPHAILTSIQLFRSHWELIKPSLEAKQIPYKLGLRGRCMDAPWRGRNVKCYTNGLIIFKPEVPELPLNVPLETIKQKAAIETGVLGEAFLSETGLRALRHRTTGQLIITLRYFENGYPSNTIAEESLKDKDRIVYVYDQKTGKAVVWADSSLATMKELETNNERVDKEMKLWLGATKTGEISPYDDEIRTRRNMDEMREIQLAQANMVTRLEIDLAKYAHNEIVHLDLLNKIRAENLKIKDMLSQKRLFQ